MGYQTMILLPLQLTLDLAPVAPGGPPVAAETKPSPIHQPSPVGPP